MSAMCQLPESVFGCTIGTGKLPGKAIGAAVPLARLPNPQAPSRGSTGAARSAAPSAGEDGPVVTMLISIAEQRSCVPTALGVCPICAIQANESVIGPTVWNSCARSAGVGVGGGGGGGGGGGNAPSSGVIWT